MGSIPTLARMTVRWRTTPTSVTGCVGDVKIGADNVTWAEVAARAALADDGELDLAEPACDGDGLGERRRQNEGRSARRTTPADASRAVGSGAKVEALAEVGRDARSG
jgi:hypothetical protein